MSKGVVWYDSVALNFKAWLDGVLTTVSIGTGDVIGPGSAANNNLASYNGTTGKLIKDSGFDASDFATLPINLASGVTGILPPANYSTEVTFTTTGNIDNLNFSNSLIIRMNNATDSVIRGLVAGSPGQVVTIISVGAGNVYLAHQNANSSSNNRLINTATSANTPLAAGSGSITYQYDSITARWRLIAHKQGAYIAVVYSAGDYTTNDGTTWSIYTPTFNLSYQLRDSQLQVIGFFDWDLSANTAVQLQAKIPNGFSAIASAQSWSFIKDNNIKVNGRLSVSPAGVNLNLTKLDQTAFTGSGGPPTFFGQNGFNLLLGVT